MTINTKNIVSITEANQNFSKVARLVDEKRGSSDFKEQCTSLPGFGIQSGGTRAEYRRRKPAGYFPAADRQKPQGFQGYSHLKPYFLV